MPQAIANGKTFDFPEGTTPEQMGQAIDEYFAGQTSEVSQQPVQSAPAVQQPSVQQNVMTPQQLDEVAPMRNMATGMPDGMPLPYGITQEMLDASNKDVQRSNEQSQQIRSDPSLQQRIKDVQSGSGLMNALRSAGHVINQFGEGAEDLVDKYLPESISNVLNYKPFGENLNNAQERMAQRKDEMAALQDEQNVRNIARPITSTLGAMLPYLGTGAIIDRGLVAGMEAISPITRQITQTALRGVGKAEGGPGIVNSIGEAANTAAARMSTAPKIVSDFDRQLGASLRAPVIGAIEGGVNYDQSALEGAALSTAGALSGNFGPLRLLNRVENVRDAATKKLVTEMDRAGFKITPGVKTGNRQMQTEEAGIKNSDVLGDYYYQKVTRPNERKMTEMAGDAIGLNGKNRDSFSPEELKGHLDNLRSQYNELELNTTGIITRSHMREAANILDDLKPTANRNRGPNDAARYQLVKSITDQIRAETTSVRPGVRTMTGAQYQQFRQRIQDEASQAFRNGDNRLGNSLNKLKASLDSSIENAMGSNNAAKWKDLNERYAMTNMLLRNGLTPSGRVDPTGITSSVMKKDEAIRTLTSQGGRIQQFQKIARYNDVLRNVEGGSLTGLGSADYSASRELSKLPFRYKLPGYARAAVRTRLGVIPTLGISPAAGINAARAAMMTDPIEKVANSAQMSVEDFKKWLSEKTQ